MAAILNGSGLVLVGARGHITLLSGHPSLLFCHDLAREEECSIFSIKSITCAVKCSIDNIVTASSLVEFLLINVSFPQNYHFVVESKIVKVVDPTVAAWVIYLVTKSNQAVVIHFSQKLLRIH